MCGIVGLFAKSPDVEERLGAHLGAMLGQMADRGPDSAGIALYREPAPAGHDQVLAVLARPGRGLGGAAATAEVARAATRSCVLDDADAPSALLRRAPAPAGR